ncbi:hypothetical protein LNP74_21470 [Klebsiella pneumoniae subsp. pneumoniae]|nr:hypothetical protein [Klebsiella pneumoniae subsp. pneumoniae]
MSRRPESDCPAVVVGRVRRSPPPGEMAGMAPIDCPPAQRLPGLGSEDRLQTP